MIESAFIRFRGTRQTLQYLPHPSQSTNNEFSLQQTTVVVSEESVLPDVCMTFLDIWRRI